MTEQASENKKDFRTWLDDNEPEETSTIFTSLILLDVLLRKNSAIRSHLLDVNDVDTIEKIANDIKKNKCVRIHNKKRRVLVLKGLYAYKTFLESKEVQLSDDDKNMTDVEDADAVTTHRIGSKSLSFEEKDIALDELARIRATLELRYNYGFKDNDDVEIYRFRKFYTETNGVECSLEKEELLRAIRSLGFEFEGKVYLISEKIMSGIESEIRGYADLGVSIIDYEALYDFRSDDYFDAKIVSAEMLKAILKRLLPEFRYKNNYLALPEEKLTELQLIRNDIIRVWGNSILQTFDELSLKLPLIPLDKIKFTLMKQSMFVRNSAETYLQKDSFEADEDEISRLIEFIDEQCEEHGKASLDEVPFENLKTNNPELSESAIINCFCRLIDDRFERNARILTRKGAGKDTYTAVLEFCRKQEKCTYERLVRIAEQVAGTVRTPDIIEAANSVMVRIDKNNFIADRLISFDADRIDSALDHIVTNEFIGMKEITTFSTLPFCGYRWNLFLLESYCRRFSKRYSFATRRVNSSNSGAIVAKNCELSYHDIMAEAAARSGRDLSKDEILDFLTETGYMERKRYSDIERLITYAEELRERMM